MIDPAIGRPCLLEHPEPARTASICSMCHLYVTNRYVRDRWNGKHPQRKSTTDQRQCIYLGPATGEQVRCPGCKGTVSIKLRACAVHGKCSQVKPLDGIHCCDGCNEKVLPDRLDKSDKPIDLGHDVRPDSTGQPGLAS